jgi:hypothetical protein
LFPFTLRATVIKVDKEGTVTDVSKGKLSWFARTVVRLNNFRKRHKNFNISPENILVLLPRCIQNSECTQNIVKDINNCKGCGRCPIKSLVSMGQEYGVIPRVATGGRLSLSYVLESWVEAVVAVACEAELKAGIFASPKPVLAVVNHRPHGPCTDTGVDLQKVREAILLLVGKKTACPARPV